MPTPELGDDRVLARKILIEGRDVDAGALGDAVRRQTAGALAHQNVSCRLKQGLHCRVRAVLPRQFPRRKLGSTSHSHAGQKCKLTEISICLHYRAMTEPVRKRRVAHARRPGGPDVLQVDVEDLASLNAGEILVRVEAAGLNHVESLIRTDAYSIRIPFPYAVGF